MSEQLKACPFCGETPEVTDHFKGEEYGSRMVHRCKTLGAISLDWQSRASILRTWNTRAQDFDTLAQRLQEAEKLLSEARHFCQRAPSLLLRVDALLASKYDKP